MMPRNHPNLGDLRRTLWTYTAATGRKDVKEETMDRLLANLIDACDNLAREHYRS